MKVHILATCLNPEMLGNTLMVFRTLRTGFPKSDITVYGNGLDPLTSACVADCAKEVWAEYQPIPIMAHGYWIELLVSGASEPFWICDTDIIFRQPVEHWAERSNELFAGRYEPDFFERWTQSRHVARLHPSLMWFNPRALRAAIRAWPGKHPFFNSVIKNLIQWSFVPFDGKLIFYDTCAGLHHALGGLPFTAEQNECFSHRFAGTYSDLMGISEADLRTHESMCKSFTCAATRTSSDACASSATSNPADLITSKP